MIMTKLSVWFIPDCSSGFVHKLIIHALKSLSKEFAEWKAVTRETNYLQKKNDPQR